MLAKQNRNSLRVLVHYSGLACVKALEGFLFLFLLLYEVIGPPGEQLPD